MKPCWIEVTILTSGEKELKNLAAFEAIRTGEDGVTEIEGYADATIVRDEPGWPPL